MDLTQKAKCGDVFFKNGQRFDFSSAGGFDRFTGSGDPDRATTLQAILDGFGAKLYVAPVFDQVAQKLDGAIVDQVDHVTEGVVDKTPAELVADLVAKGGTAKERVKQLRQFGLERWTKNSGVYAVYAENYEAAVAQQAGSGAATFMRDGRSATDYLAGLGARLGKSADEFADYVVQENRLTVGPTMAQIEDEYLRLYYGVIDAFVSAGGDGSDVQLVVAAMSDIDTAVEAYRVMCEG